MGTKTKALVGLGFLFVLSNPLDVNASNFKSYINVDNYARFDINDWYYSIEADGSYTLNAYNGMDGNIEIPGQIENGIKINYGSNVIYYNDVYKIKFKEVNGNKVRASENIRFENYSIEELDLTGLDTSNTTNMSYMFNNLYNLKSLDVSMLDTSNVEYMNNMFYSLGNLESLDVSNFDTSKVKSMAGMFSSLYKLTDLNISGLDTSNVEDMNDMFAYLNNVQSLDVSSFNTSKVTNMSRMFYGVEKVKTLNVSGFDTSNVTNMSFMFSNDLGESALESIDLSGFNTSKVENFYGFLSGASNLSVVDVSNFDTSKTTDMGSMFTGLKSVESLDVSGFDTSKTTNMNSMFNGLESVESIDVSGFNTSNVTNLSGMFGNMKNLKSVDVSNFDTSKVTDMSCLFNFNESLESIDVSNFDTSKVTDMGQMFTGLELIKSLDVSNFDTSNVYRMNYMFSGLKSLKELNVSNFNTSNVMEMNSMFSSMDSLKSLDLSNFDTSNTVDMAFMFSSSDNLEFLDVSSFDTSNVGTMSYMFSGLYYLENLDVSGFNTSNAYTMDWMFSSANNLKALDVSNFDTSNVNSMIGMFQGLSSVDYLDVSGFDTSKVVDMSSMFSGMNSLTSLDVSGFNTSRVTNMEYMFSHLNNIKSLDISGFETSRVTSMSSMFSNMNSLTSLDVSGFETSIVTNMGYMFDGLNNIKSLDVSNFDTSKVQFMYNMFSNLSLIESLDLSSFDTSKVLSMSHLFNGMESLKSLDISNFDTSNVNDMSYMFSGLKSLTSLGVSNLDTTYVTTMEGMFNNLELVEELDLTSFETKNIRYISNMFNGMKNLESLDVSHFNTSKVEDLSNVFSNTDSLSKIDISSWDTSNVETMFNTFYQSCSNAKLTEINISGIDLTSLLDSYSMSMLSGYNNVILYSDGTKYNDVVPEISSNNSILIIGDNLPYTEEYLETYSNKSPLKFKREGDEHIYYTGEIILSNAEANNIEKTLLNHVDKLVEENSDKVLIYDLKQDENSDINSGNKIFDTYGVTYRYKENYRPIVYQEYESGFVGQYDNIMDLIKIHDDTTTINNLKIKIEGDIDFNTPGEYTAVIKVTDEMDLSTTLNLTYSVYSEGFILDDWTHTEEEDIIKISGYEGSSKNLFIPGEVEGKNIVVSNLDWIRDIKLESLQFKKVNNSKVIYDNDSFKGVFTNSSNVSFVDNLDLSGLDTSRVTDMSYAFMGSAFKSLNLDGLDTSNVTNMEGMFMHNVNSYMYDLNFDTRKVKNMDSMFFMGGTGGVAWTPMNQVLDLSSFYTPSLETVDNFFDGNFSVGIVNMENFTLNKVDDISKIFSYDKRMEYYFPGLLICKDPRLNFFNFDNTPFEDKYRPVINLSNGQFTDGSKEVYLEAPSVINNINYINSMLQGVEKPTRENYYFSGWKLLESELLPQHQNEIANKYNGVYDAVWVENKQPQIIIDDEIIIEQNEEFDLNTYLEVIDENATVEDAEVSGYVDTNEIGTYSLTIKVTDEFGLKAEKNITVEVVNANIAPVIAAEDSLIHQNTEFDPLIGVSANDEEDGDITSSIYLVENNVNTEVPGQYSIIYGVKDSKGLEATLEVFVTVNGVPTLNVVDKVLYTDEEFNLNHVSATDHEDGDISSAIKYSIIEKVDTTKPGEYTVEYQVTDSHGYTTKATGKVTVKERDGWVVIGDDKYYYEDGQKVTGWRNIDGRWYYFNDAGDHIENDWNTHYANDEIKYAMDKGWVDNSTAFRPEDKITRAEFIKIVNRAYGYTAKASKHNFSDVNSYSWFYNDVLIAIKNNVINPNMETFRPDESITREEVAEILTNINNNKDRNYDKIYKYLDASEISNWAKPAVEGAVEAGYMGKDVSELNPKDSITRGDAILMVSRSVK